MRFVVGGTVRKGEMMKREVTKGGSWIAKGKWSAQRKKIIVRVKVGMVGMDRKNVMMKLMSIRMRNLTEGRKAAIIINRKATCFSSMNRNLTQASKSSPTTTKNPFIAAPRSNNSCSLHHLPKVTHSNNLSKNSPKLSSKIKSFLKPTRNTFKAEKIRSWINKNKSKKRKV